MKKFYAWWFGWHPLGLLMACCLFSSGLYAQSGAAFRDGNGDGIRQPGERGIPGILVKSYVNAGSGDQLLGQATTGPTGSYTLTPAAATGQKVRVEFTIPANGCSISADLDFTSTGGANYGTSVQFVTGPVANVNFGVLNADEYIVSSNPMLFVPCYVNGSMSSGSVSGNADVLVKFAYNNAGVPQGYTGGVPTGTPRGPDPIHLAVGSNVGTVWGVAYSKQAKRVFVSAFLKRHSGMGPGGPGAIYQLDPANTTLPASATPTFTSLDALGFPTSGTGTYTPTITGFHPVIGSNAQRGLTAGGNLPSADPSAFGQVGKVSLGDLDISSDGRYLFTVNLFDRKIYRLDLGADPVNPVLPKTAAGVKSYDNVPWLTQSCPGGVARPFGLKVYRGKLYVGVVCSGENKTWVNGQRQLNADLRAYIYEIDPAGTGAGRIYYEFPLNYDKENAGSGDNSPVDGWYWWNDDWNNHLNPAYCCGNAPGAPAPILSGIEFDADGSLIMAFMDRGGHQWGVANYSPAGSGSYSKVIAGDILRTYRDPLTCVQKLEENGVAGPYVSTSSKPVSDTADPNVISGTGPATHNGVGAAFTGYTDADPTAPGSGKEFYWGDYANIFGNNYPQPHHNEGIMGAVAILPSSGEVIATGLDPVDNVAWAAGTYRLDNATGRRTTGYNLYSNASPTAAAADVGPPGKANGLGDIDITGDIPPIEIGNRVWADTDGDGIQDADESGINGVVVELWKGNTRIASTTTANGGQWYFSTKSKLGSSWTGTGADTALLATTAYVVKFTTPLNSGVLNGYTSLAPKDRTGAGQADISDSDAALNGSVPEIALTTDVMGKSNHTFDVGYVLCSPPALTATPGACNPASNQYALTGTISLTNSPGGTLTLTDNGANTALISTTLSVPVGTTSLTFSLTGLVSGGRTHTVTASFSNTLCGTSSLTYLSPTSCTAAPCVGTNLLANPSFEQGLPVPPTGQSTQTPPPGWTGGTADNNPKANFAAPDGYAFGFTGDNGGSLCQSVSATAGSTYQLTFFAGVHQVNGQRMTLSFLNSSSAVIGSPASFSITHILDNTNVFGGPYSLSGVAPAGTNQVRVCAVSGNGTGSAYYAKIDNLCLTGTAAPCALTVAVTTPVCNTATNQYTLSGTVSLTNATASTATVTDGATSTTLAVAAGQSSVPFSLSGLLSGTGARTVLVTLPGCGSASVGYTAPAACASLSLTSATVCAGQTVSLTAIGCAQTVTFAGGGTTNGNVLTIATLASPTTTTISTYTATCVSSGLSATGTVTVNPVPSLTLTQVPAGTVTTGSTLTLSAQGCTGGTLVWSGNTASHNGATATVVPLQPSQVYSATCTSAAGCVGTASLTVTTVPAPSVTLSSATVCAGQTVSLTATGCAGTLSFLGGGSVSGNLLSIATSAGIATQTVQSYTALCTIAATGATASAVGTVTTVPLPTPTLLASTSLATAGSAITLTAGGCSGGTLSGAVSGTVTSAVVMPAVGTNVYSVTCTVLPGCTGVASVSVTGVAPLSLVATSATVCAGQTASLTALGCTGSVSWTGASIGSGVNSPVLTVSTSATLNNQEILSYVVNCTAAQGGQVSSATATVTVNPLPNLALTQAPSGTVTTGTAVTLAVTGCTGGTPVWSASGTSANAGQMLIVQPMQPSQVYSVTCATVAGCVGTASLTVTTVLPPAQLVLSKQVSTNRARLGDVVSYTVTLANVGAGSSSAVVVTDVLQGVSYVPGSATTSPGSFVPSATGGNWSVPVLPPSTTATLVYSASVVTEGVAYNTATIPSQTATVCTSVPIRVCDNEPFAVTLSAPAGYTSYKWFRLGDSQPVYDGPLNSFTATQVGEYRVTVNDGPGQCADGSCCPAIIEAIPFPSVTALAVAPGCQGNVPLANGQVKLAPLGSTTSLTGLRYELSAGDTFDAGRVLAQGNVPVSGVLANDLAVGLYTIRLRTETGCQQDITVTLSDTCVCPAPKCVPFVIRQTKRVTTR